MICTVLSRVLEDFQRVPWTMFLTRFHAPGKANNGYIMKIPLTQTKRFLLLV